MAEKCSKGFKFWKTCTNLLFLKIRSLVIHHLPWNHFSSMKEEVKCQCQEEQARTNMPDNDQTLSKNGRL